MARNQWFTAVEQTMPEYIPLPMEQLFQAGQAIQNRYDTNMANIDAVGTGLASIEARLSGHKQYVDNLSNNYKAEVDQLLTKYNNNASDPQFARDFNRIKTKYANDRNLSTIALANEAAKRNDAIAANLAAEGRLFINPQGTGVDAQGNLISDVGEIRQVNTLNDWANRLKIAAGTMNEEGNLITNKTSLKSAKKQIEDAIKSGSPEVTDLVQAYMTRGMSRDAALNQVAQDAQRLSGEYAESSQTNWKKLDFEENVRHRKEMRDIERAKLRASQQASGGSGGIGSNGTYFVRTAERNPERTAVIAQSTKVNDLVMPLAGRSNVNFNTPFKGNLPAGERFVFTKGRFNDGVYKKSGTAYIKDGVFTGVEVPYMINTVVNAKDGKVNSKYSNKVGRLITTDEGWNQIGDDGNVRDVNIHTDSKGDYVWMDKDRTVKGYVQPQAMGVYKDNESDATIYRKLNRDETLMYLGPDAGHYSNDGYSRQALDKANPQELNAIYQSFIKQNGRKPSDVELTDSWTLYRDYKEYQNRHSSRFDKPSTTRPINDFYGLGN